MIERVSRAALVAACALIVAFSCAAAEADEATLLAQATATPPSAGDLPGSKDPAFLKRYEGSSIVYALSRTFDQYALAVPDPAKPGNPTIEQREGAITRLYYSVPEGHTALELFRNYEQAAKEAGLAISFELLPCKEDWGNAAAHFIFGQVRSNGLNFDPFVSQGGSAAFAPTLGPYCYFTAKGQKDGQDIALTVEVVEEIQIGDSKQAAGINGIRPIDLKAGRILVGVDVVTAKVMDAKMIAVRSADVADPVKPAAPPQKPAPDLPGTKDPAFLKRYEGSSIVYSFSRSFDQYAFIVPDPKNPGATIAEPREGAITRLYYSVPEGRTALELLRNYEQAAKEAGLEIAFELLPCKEDWQNTIPHFIFGQLKSNGLKVDPFVSQGGSAAFAPTLGPYCYFTAKGQKDGQNIALTVEVVEENQVGDFKQAAGMNGVRPIDLKAGHILVGVDVVAAKAMEVRMVEVKASDMADALATKGSVDLYGILFDVDKTDIKPESVKTLDEVATLLKIDRSLRLEISGHTDNTGTAEHNLKLSEGRAQAVVEVLAKKYGIDPGRMEAKGYGDTKPVADNATDAGKAKNRRVELRKL